MLGRHSVQRTLGQQSERLPGGSGVGWELALRRQVLAGPRVCHKESIRGVCESWGVLGWLMAAVLLPASILPILPISSFQKRSLSSFNSIHK